MFWQQQYADNCEKMQWSWDAVYNFLHTVCFQNVRYNLARFYTTEKKKTREVYTNKYVSNMPFLDAMYVRIFSRYFYLVEPEWQS